MHRIVLETRIAATPDRVWRHLSDHEAMPGWFPAREVVRRLAGHPDPDGDGAVRVMRTRGLAIEEEITGWKPHERMDYALVAGAPFREYRGEVRLVPFEAGTRVSWTLTFRPLLPGTANFLRRLVERTLAEGLDGLREKSESP